MSQQVNLYHPIFRKQEKKFSALTMLQATLLVLAAIVLMYVFSVWQVRSLQSQAAQIEQQYRAVSDEFSDINQQLSARQLSPFYAAEITRLEGRIQAAQTIRELARHDYFFGGNGYSDFFIAFARQAVSGLWLTGFTVTGAGEQLALEGRTETPTLVPVFLQKLSAEKLLIGTEFDAFQITRPENADRKGFANYIDFSVRTRDLSHARPADGVKR